MSSSESVATAQFPPVVLSIESGLASPGDTISCRDAIDIASFEMGGRVFGLPEGLLYDVALTNTGEGILATGIVRGTVETQCDRCLDPAHLNVSAEVSCYFLREEPDDEAEEDDFGLINHANGTVDLSEAIQGAVAMDIPYVVLCREDCRGLCPVCGANLNEVECGCTVEPDPDFERANPFAALANYTFEDGSMLADHADELLDDGPSDEDDLSDDEFEAAWDVMHGGAGEEDGSVEGRPCPRVSE